MGRAAAAELPAKVKVQVQAEFQIDLLDYVPLADRHRLLMSRGAVTWDSDMAARRVTPQILKDVFLEDLTHALNPISSLFTEEHTNICNARDAQISPQQIYSVVVPCGRTAEVTVHTATLNPNPLENFSPNFLSDTSKDFCFRAIELNGCNNSQTASGSGFQCHPHGHAGDSCSSFVIKTILETSNSSATYPVVESLCKDGERLQSLSSEFSRDDFNHTSLKKRLRMLSNPCINQHCDECTQCQQTSRICSLQVDILSQNKASGITLDSEKNRLNSSYSKTDGEDVGHTQDMSVCAEELMLKDETKESYVCVSSSGASCYVCQLPQNSTNCVNFPQESQEIHPSGSRSVCMPEIPVVSQSEAPQSAENQILEPIPLLIKEELKDEALKNSSSSQFYGATVKQNSCSSFSESPHFGNLRGCQFEVNDYQGNASFRPCNLPESKVAASTGIDLPSLHMLNVLGGEGNDKVSVDTVNEKLSSGRSLFVDPGMLNLQNKLKLELREEASNQYPCNHILEDLQKQTSDSPVGSTTDNLLACNMLISPSGNDTGNGTEETSTHGTLESEGSFCQTSISEEESTVLGKRRIQLDFDNQIADSSLSSSLVSVKIEPAEWNNSVCDSQINSREQLSSSTSFSDKTFMLSPCASQLCSEAFNCEQSIFSVATTAYPPEVDLPLPGKRQTCFEDNEDVVNSLSSAAIKAEPFNGNPDNIAPEHPGRCSTAYDFSVSPLEVKVDPLEMVKAPVNTEVIQELSMDGTDHIPLQERMKMIISSRNPEFKICDGPKTSHNSVKSLSSMSVTDPVNLVGSISTNSAHGRKRKKTATDSVETALEEDAPALLQVLIENGIDLKKIKLYEVMDDNGTLDTSSEDNFHEFENVIFKLFSERPSSLFKLCKLHNENGTKAAYCLPCLISLIEQTHYMQLRNFPVEWGWCRDLQSFIFVFERHNRIVLERPEYGYATYFFELVDSFPIAWQIRRLITAMKLAKYSRITLIENKSLMVGEDLTEGEARILKEYGWKPNSGLGSFLNFCDRVVHDRRNETNYSDWRCKIGKLLKNGYDSGRIVTADLPKKVVEYVNNQQQAIKLELDV